MKGPQEKRGWGFTLLEALLAAVILAMAVTAITMPFTAAAQNEQFDARRTLAVTLAQEMMEEILTRAFDDPDGPSSPGPEPGETSRGRYDNIDDYNGLVEPSGCITSMDGKVISSPESVGLSRHVSAAYVYVSGQDTRVPPTFIRVTVTVKHKGQAIVTLIRLVYAMR
jgi:type II secretory pathway pseudopilin PulG